MDKRFKKAIEALEFLCQLDAAPIQTVDDKGKVISSIDQGREDEITSYRAAIRLLEAAGKVDKKACLMFLGWTKNMWGQTHPQACQIADLLAALPDEVKP